MRLAARTSSVSLAAVFAFSPSIGSDSAKMNAWLSREGLVRSRKLLDWTIAARAPARIPFQRRKPSLDEYTNPFALPRGIRFTIRLDDARNTLRAIVRENRAVESVGSFFIRRKARCLSEPRPDILPSRYYP